MGRKQNIKLGYHLNITKFRNVAFCCNTLKWPVLFNSGFWNERISEIWGTACDAFHHGIKTWLGVTGRNHYDVMDNDSMYAKEINEWAYDKGIGYQHLHQFGGQWRSETGVVRENEVSSRLP